MTLEKKERESFKEDKKKLIHLYKIWFKQLDKYKVELLWVKNLGSLNLILVYNNNI